MTTKEQIFDYIQWHDQHYGKETPIFEIVMLDHPDRELVFHQDGKDIPSGYPDAAIERMGFYYDLDTAIRAMNGNWCDMQETCYHAGFILCHFPGLYDASTVTQRMYFVWDEARRGFYEAEEPKIFEHIAY